MELRSGEEARAARHASGQRAARGQEEVPEELKDGWVFAFSKVLERAPHRSDGRNRSRSKRQSQSLLSYYLSYEHGSETAKVPHR